MDTRLYSPKALRVLVTKDRATEELQVRYIKAHIDTLADEDFLPEMNKITELGWKKLFLEIRNSWNQDSKVYRAFFRRLSKEDKAIMSIRE
ncbi:MAG: hypothetical protein AMQ74_01867 [Candidatus Methanofastidiosum methylothiophilum]|uniref:Uncharacterized protein n=1 Tax=Candidatus Methanofastidiosum methylothiophilum TaxID=1705564 RepID=A0A150IMI3_9EURY|nr:MAG: hypothetical protein AMQ74_01867 [Candidatus Methanofastidiosum methylthiophilus]